MNQRVILLGSTGSIGRNTLEVLAALQDRCKLVGLAAGTRWTLLAEQARRWRPDGVAITETRNRSALAAALDGRTKLFAGPTALADLVEAVECDCVVSAVVGAAGLPATLRAVELGRDVALANKETLVVAGSVIAPLAKRTGSRLIPIDSEHSAIFQCLHAGKSEEVRRVYLTASGGPFRSWNKRQIEQATLADALTHPTWDMGPKITIDSATMMNKALEIIEACWLFDLPHDKIEVVVHPESIVHSLVEFCDGSIIAQLSAPDMRTPIQYALTFPDRLPGVSDGLDLLSHRQMSFHPPDPEKFPALRLGHETAGRGGTAGAVLNGANETAVELFRAGRIRFPEIVEWTEEVLRRHAFVPEPSLDDLLAADRWARNEVAQCIAC